MTTKISFAAEFVQADDPDSFRISDLSATLFPFSFLDKLLHNGQT